MATFPESLPLEPSRSRKRALWPRVLKYTGVAVACNAAFWGVSLLYLKKTPPTYTSELILNVAGNGQGVNVNLPDVGQAVTSTTSAFGSSSDPRENYKLIASGAMVLKAAAKSAGLSEKQFGEPKINLINNTTTLKVEMSGKSPAQAQKKALAVYVALAKRLDILRAAEQAERGLAIEAAVDEAQSKLRAAQLRLSQYKTLSGLSSSEQVTGLITSIEELRKQRSELVATERQTRDRLQKLSTSLQLSPREAADALLLQTDRQLQKSLKEYTEATITLETLQEDRGPNYPDVVVAKQQQDAALKVVLERGRALLGKPISRGAIERLSLDNSDGSGVQRGELFKQLIATESEHRGLVGQLDALTGQIAGLEKRLQILVQKESILDRRLRELQIAEAVFTSTLAKVDLGKSDPFGSFPLLQLIEEPSLLDEPTAPKKKLVIIGTVLGSFLITLGLTLIWWREPILAATKKATRDILA